jgi:hypothetical protein
MLESLERLQVDARWWLQSSKGEVRTVILIAIKRNAPSITLQKWEQIELDQHGKKKDHTTEHSGNLYHARQLTRSTTHTQL